MSSARQKKLIINVITYGTFDLFHIGHLEILRRAKSLGSHLTVAVSTDRFNIKKNKKCVYPFEQRAAIVNAIKYVDRVIPEETWEQKTTDIKNYNIDIFVMGDDWKGRFEKELYGLCEIKYLERTKDISSTIIKNNVIKNNI